MVARGDGDVINVASVSGKRPLVAPNPVRCLQDGGHRAHVDAGLRGRPGRASGSTASRPVRSPGRGWSTSSRLDAEHTGGTYDDAVDAVTSRAALRRMVTEDEVGAAAVAMLAMTGMCGADIDLSAGVVA